MKGMLPVSLILLLLISALTIPAFPQGSPNVPLLKHLDDYPSQAYNDCWGYIAPDGREYALLGVQNGTSIVDITDAANAEEVAFFSSASSIWKDLKTYQHYAYAVNESSGGLQIFDLSGLPDNATQLTAYTGFNDMHNIYIDEENAMLYASPGSGNAPCQAISLADPENPVFQSSFGIHNHDAFARDNLVYLSEGGNGSFSIYDLSIPTSPQFVQRQSIPASGYVHNIWLTDDSNYLMTTEETSGKTVKMWDIRNLNNIQLLDTYLGPNNLAHNTHIKGNYAYLSHYGSGLRILDISDPSDIFEVGFYNTADAWGAWPFFSSGKILISDFQNGLYVVSFDGAADGSTFQEQVQSGWNMVGLPNQPENTNYTDLFPNAMPNTLFSFDGTYQMETDLIAGRGYWLNFPAQETVPITGSTINSVTIDLRAGWNIISGVSKNVDLVDVADDDNIIIPNSLFGFSGSYTEETTIEQGVGYWINATTAGQITIDANAAKNGNKRVIDVPSRNEQLAGFPALQVGEKASGKSQRLFYDVDPQRISNAYAFSLPPVAPAGMNSFDARFDGDLQITSDDESVIRLQSANYPLAVRPSGNSSQTYILQEIVAGNISKTHIIVPGEEILITDSRVMSLRLSRIVSEVPETFVVEQNFPNPFNPTTEIRYSIPENEAVEIAVYNTVGQKVKTLLNTNQEAGRHSVAWDGTNDFGSQVSSGTYLYRVTAGAYSEIKKMVLLR